MLRVCQCLSLAAFLPGAILGQPAGELPRFEVADVHTSARTSTPLVRGPFYSTGRYEMRFATMLDLVRVAYGVEPERVFGGPSWLEMDRFDVLAKVPAGSTPESRRLMLQALLEERFHLAAHKETKPMAAHALTSTKHPLLKEASGSGETGCNFKVQNPQMAPPAGGAPQVISLPVIEYTCRNTTMAAFADGMFAMAGAAQYFNNKPVVDKTELTGAWDFVMRYTPKIPAGIATTGENIPFPEALEKQLGLKLDAANVPVPSVVVDSVNEKPTPNSPDVAKSFPELPTEFEVAEIKPTPPAPNGGRGGDNLRPEIKNGRMYLPGLNMKTLIIVAWDLSGDEMIAGAPKWFDDDRFDNIAKAPAGVAMGELTPQRNSMPINIDALRPMLRALIVERFKMVSHMENRPVSAYTLTAAKPKLKKADPTTRTKWQEGSAADAKDNKNANASLGRLVTCQNVSMAQFADLLPGIAPGYIHSEVLDATGLEGGYDFTFSFSPAGLFQMNAGRSGDGAGAGSAPEASEPSGALSLFDALSKQLGLKLEQQKRPAPVLVIDRIERKPTDN